MSPEENPHQHQIEETAVKSALGTWFLHVKCSTCQVLLGSRELNDTSGGRPLSSDIQRKQLADHQRVEGIVHVSYRELVAVTLEGFLDLISNRLVGHDCLMGTSHTLVGREGDYLLLLVSGELEEVFDGCPPDAGPLPKPGDPCPTVSCGGILGSTSEDNATCPECGLSWSCYDEER